MDFRFFFWIMAAIWSSLIGCNSSSDHFPKPQSAAAAVTSQPTSSYFAKIPVQDSVPLKGFFSYLNQLLTQIDSTPGYQISEPLLLRANPWILDRLVATDYDNQMAAGHFIYDQRELDILRPGDSITIPNAATAQLLSEKIAKTNIDINIPAFELRVLEADSVLYRIKIRVGKNEKKYLAMAKTTVDLRTHTGLGKIIRVNKNPVFYDPVDMKIFKETKRDDHRKTKMPLIPWLEPEINGIRYGQLIHPTTNPKTLGKPSSNGCIGTSEADAWRIYFYAPVGTPVQIRYQLQVIQTQGDTIQLKDIYPKKGPKVTNNKVPAPKVATQTDANACWCEEHQS